MGSDCRDRRRVYGAQNVVIIVIIEIIVTCLYGAQIRRQAYRSQIVARAFGAQIVAMGLQSSDFDKGPTDLRLWQRADGDQIIRSSDSVDRLTELRM